MESGCLEWLSGVCPAATTRPMTSDPVSLQPSQVLTELEAYPVVVRLPRESLRKVWGKKVLRRGGMHLLLASASASASVCGSR
jgi:hypothetical protein